MNLNKRRGAPQHDDRHGFVTLLIKAFLVFTISVIIFGYYYFLIAINPNNLRDKDDSSRSLEKQQLITGKQPIATIGYAVTVSGCPGKSVRGDFGAGISDGAAVLKHSIHLNSIQNYEHSQSLFDYKMYALVHVDAESCARDALEPLGYEILLRLVCVCVCKPSFYRTHLIHSHNTSEMYQFH